MCPFCLATAALIAGSTTVAGGAVLLAVKKVLTRSGEVPIPIPSPTEEVPNHDNHSHSA